MSTEQNKALVREFFAGWNSGNLDRMVGVLVEEYQHHDPSLPPELQRGRENYRKIAEMLLGAFPGLEVTIEDQVAEGDKVATRCTCRGTQRGALMGIPPSGKQVEFVMTVISRIADGKIAEGWVNFDALGMLQQIGALPSPEQQVAT